MMLSEQFHRIGTNGRKYYGLWGAGILFTDGDRILLLRRNVPSDCPQKWGLPGGRAEKGESAIDCARREAKEECGVLTGTRFANFEEIDGKHRFYVFLYAVDSPFECKLTKEHDKWEWVPLGDLEKYDLHPRLEKQIPYYRKAISRRFPPKKFAEWLACR